MREFTVIHLGQSRSAPGGRQLVGQAANLTFESACIGYYRPNIRPSPLVLLLNHEVDTHLPSLGEWKAESGNSADKLRMPRSAAYSAAE